MKIEKRMLFQGGAEVSDGSDDEAADKCSLSDDEKPMPLFRAAVGAQLSRKLIINSSVHNGPDHEGLRRTTSSLARLSMAIRRSLRLPRRSESRMQKQREDHEWTQRKPSDARKFTENTRDTRLGPSAVPSNLDEIKENRRLNRVEKVKKIVRKTDWPVRHEARAALWKELCQCKDFDSSRALYLTELDNVRRITAGRSQSPHFLSEEGTIINNFDLNELGGVKLLRLLTVIERLRPELSSAPMLYPLCALMLHFMDDEDAFGCIHYLLNNRGFVLTSPVQWAASAHTILALLKKHKAAAYTTLKRRIGTADDVILVRCIKDWLEWLFRGLPLAYACRVVDCFLVEGQKFLIRSAISVIYIWAKMQKSKPGEDLGGKSIDEKVDAIKAEILHTASHIQLSSDTFIETAVKIRNLQSATIARLQTHYEDKLRGEVKPSAPLTKQRKTLYTDAFVSVIIDIDSAAELMSNFPPRLQLITPRLLFRLSQDGASFTHMWSKIDAAEQTLLIIRSIEGDVFGAYCSASWAERNDRKERTRSKYFGTGESYVWRLNTSLGLPEIYNWVGNAVDHPNDIPQLFMTANDRLLVIGSGDGDAIRISEELTHGMSSSSRTFGSPSLLSKGNVFDIHELEVFEVCTSS